MLRPSCPSDQNACEQHVAPLPSFGSARVAGPVNLQGSTSVGRLTQRVHWLRQEFAHGKIVPAHISCTSTCLLCGHFLMQASPALTQAKQSPSSLENLQTFDWC